MSHVPFVTIDPDANIPPLYATTTAAATTSTIPDPVPARSADSLRTSSASRENIVAATDPLLADSMSATSTSAAPVDTTRPLTAKKKNRGSLPSWIAFPLTVVLSLGLSASLYSAVPQLVGYELAAVSRTIDEPWEIGSLLAWKVVEMAVSWSVGLDYLDILSLALLSNVPYYVLLNVFYETSYKALAASFTIDMISLALPFSLLRPLNFYNARKRTSRPQSVSEIASDRSINMYMTALAAALYSLVVYSSFYTWLPVYMIKHFDEVRSLEAAHNATLPILLIACIPIGYAAKNFLFKPSIAAARPLIDPFDPVTASLPDTVRYNLGVGLHSSRASILTTRTTLLIVNAAINTFVRVFGTVEGTDALGAAGWAGLWSAAALMVGVGFAWAAES
ncbi:hypothetical protein AAFC00_004612 [Neodothiora populina]|uniref:Uncharacterized protein n=1 Tax=Neodothiora populina TaxID=2781224 RepID=A0ABR3P2X0_9PEZI